MKKKPKTRPHAPDRVIKVSVSIPASLVQRVSNLAAAQGIGRSTYITKLIRDSVEDQEITVKALQDPLILQAFAAAFSNRDVIKHMAAVMQEDLKDGQLELFQKQMGLLGEQITAKSPGQKMGT